MSALRILIADDHEVVRQGLRALLRTESGWEICAEAATGREAVEAAKKFTPQVVVMDISMPELNGLEATRQILKACPPTEVLILSMHESEELVRQIVEAGARGYLLKSDAGRDLVAAVQALSGHKVYFTSRVADLVLSSPSRLHAQASAQRIPRSRLTAREREIVQLLAEGRSNKEVADALQISTKTAETHRANIMRKLNLASFSELVRYAIRNKIIEP